MACLDGHPATPQGFAGESGSLADGGASPRRHRVGPGRPPGTSPLIRNWPTWRELPLSAENGAPDGPLIPVLGGLRPMLLQRAARPPRQAWSAGEKGDPGLPSGSSPNSYTAVR